MEVVRPLRRRTEDSAEDLDALETDLLAGFVLARASAGMADQTIRHNVAYLEEVRAWLQRPVWTMQPADADRYFGQYLRAAAPGSRSARASTLVTYFHYLDVRHRAELYHRTGYVPQCPVDELNRPARNAATRLRIPPSELEMRRLFTGWREDLATCRKYAPAARTYAACRLMAQVGLRINELLRLDLRDVHWELGQLGQLHVRYGKGSRGRGPKVRLVPLINDARHGLQWYVEDVWSSFGLDASDPGVPLFPSERAQPGGRTGRANDDTLRQALAVAVDRHLPTWTGRLTPHVLRHYCASHLYAGGMDLLAVQELLGHDWISTTMRYVHVQRDHVSAAWLAAQQRAARRLTPLNDDEPTGGPTDDPGVIDRQVRAAVTTRS
jgi:site-specific recombinase XerD